MQLIAPYCRNSCLGCHNAQLRNTNLKDFSISYIIEEYNSNPFWEGITVSGLEPEHSGEYWWWDLQTIVDKTGTENLTVYTSTEIVRDIKVKNLYYKTGEYRRADLPHAVTIGDWSIVLASQNQRFFKV
jgi:organic radical activating enzyme